MRVFGALRNMGDGRGLSPVSYYRVGLPLKALDEYTKHEAKAYDQLTLYNMFNLAVRNGKSPESALGDFDIYCISRLYHDWGADDFVEAIHEKGGITVFDTDDDLTEEYRDLDGRGDEFIRQLGRVDLVTVSTPYLAERLGRYARRKPVVLPNHVDFGWFRESSLMAERRFDGLTIGVIGTATHYDDWKCLERPFARLAEKYDVTILVAGTEIDYLEDHEMVSGVPYRYYPQLMRQFDIVCCTLDPEDRFNWSKSGIKSLEAMSSARRDKNGKVVGAVPVCTDMALYRRIVNDGHNGFLVDNDDWYEVLSRLIEDERTRNRVAYQGHRWVRDNRDIRCGYRMWKRAYLDALEAHHGTS